jgi:hypothetical protein
MIADILFTIIGWILGTLAFLLPTWTLWPTVVLDSLTYMAQSMAKLNFIFPIDTLFTILSFLINYFVLYAIAKIIVMGINFFRGSGGIEI